MHVSLIPFLKRRSSTIFPKNYEGILSGCKPSMSIFLSLPSFYLLPPFSCFLHLYVIWFLFLLLGSFMFIIFPFNWFFKFYSDPSFQEVDWNMPITWWNHYMDCRYFSSPGPMWEHFQHNYIKYATLKARTLVKFWMMKLDDGNFPNLFLCWIMCFLLWMVNFLSLTISFQCNFWCDAFLWLDLSQQLLN